MRYVPISLKYIHEKHLKSTNSFSSSICTECRNIQVSLRLWLLVSAVVSSEGICVVWNDTFRDGAPSWDIIATVFSAFYVKILGIKSLIGILTIVHRRFQSQFFFGQRYICKIEEFFWCSHNQKLIENLWSCETRLTSELIWRKFVVNSQFQKSILLPCLRRFSWQSQNFAFVVLKSKNNEFKGSASSVVDIGHRTFNNKIWLQL